MENEQIAEISDKMSNEIKNIMHEKGVTSYHLTINPKSPVYGKSRQYVHRVISCYPNCIKKSTKLRDWLYSI